LKKSNVDVKEFPDGGRATLVRRYSPALTNRQLAMLQRLRSPGHFPGQLGRLPRQLARLHLLEEIEPGTFRRTDAGTDVVHRWHSAGWAP
jgi:hypothetical protein